MMKAALAAIGAAGLATSVLLAAPATASTGADIAVTSVRTGGITGVYGNGSGTVSNVGSAVIPKGTTLNIVVDDMPGLPDEIHANSISFSDLGFASIVPKDLATQKWKITTLKDLKPGESQKFKYTVLHYALWHRVKHQISVASIPGLTDTNTANDVAAGLNL